MGQGVLDALRHQRIFRGNAGPRCQRCQQCGVSGPLGRHGDRAPQVCSGSMAQPGHALFSSLLLIQPKAGRGLGGPMSREFDALAVCGAEEAAHQVDHDGLGVAGEWMGTVLAHGLRRRVCLADLDVVCQQPACATTLRGAQQQVTVPPPPAEESTPCRGLGHASAQPDSTPPHGRR